MASPNASRRQRSIQQQVARADKARPKEEPKQAMQAGARKYPAPPFPKQHRSKPGSESDLDPAPLYDAPFYLGSGKLDKKVALITGGDSGIGRAVSILFAREGADIAVAYLSEHKDAHHEREGRSRRPGMPAHRRRCFQSEVLRQGGRADGQGIRAARC